MLTFFMWAFGVSIDTSYNGNVKTIAGSKYKNKDHNFSHFQTVEIEEGEFIIIESEPEFEIELTWLAIPTKVLDFEYKYQEYNSNSYTAKLNSSKENIHLYDLYCNWKFHLS